MENWKKNITPQPGDLIKVRRSAGYCHFGIAISSKEVIHFSGLQGDDITNPENIKIRKAPLKMFYRDDELEVLADWLSPFTAKEVIKRASAYLDSSYFRGKYYNFVTNNCEHFARFIYFGDASSKQVNNAAAVAAALAGAVITATAITVKNAVKDKNNKRK